MSNLQKSIKISLFILGSFSFGWVLGIVFHELGHAIAMWLTGGIVDRITINPLSWSYTFYGSVPKYPQFTTWGGVLFGSILGLILLFVIRKLATPYAVPFLFLGLAPLLDGGGYYVVDTLLSSKGDPVRLIQLGVPKFVVLGAGAILLATGGYGTIRLMHRVGITAQDTFLKRIGLLGFGILPYFFMTFVHTLLYEREDILLHLSAIVIVSCLVVFAAWVSLRSLQPDKVSASIEWKHTIYAAVLGLLAIIVPYSIFAG